jgi:hypothetical protein
MDNQYKKYQDISSEMSAFVTPEYMHTHQYQTNDNKTCWEFFRMMFGNTFGNVRAEIHTPKRLGLEPGQVISGPTPMELDVGAMIDFIDNTGPSASDRWEYLAKDKETDEPLPGVLVLITKQGSTREIKQGKTVILGENKGKIRLFGAEGGDKVLFSRTEQPIAYQFLETLVPVGKKGSSGISAQDPQVVYLNSMSGIFTLLSETTFDESGNLIYQAISNVDFSSIPTLEAIPDSGVSNTHTLSGSASGYTVNLTKSMESGGKLVLRAPDNSGTTFFVQQNLAMFNVDSNQKKLACDHNNFNLFLDSSSADLNQIAVLSYDFPGPSTGLPDSVLCASPIYAINGTPESVDISGHIRIFYFADTLEAAIPGAVKIYHWKNGWQPLSTSVDMVLGSASCEIEESGLYAVFLDLTKSQEAIISNLTEIKHQSISILYPNYPNPFNLTTTIKYHLLQPGHVTLKIYNITGQEVATLVNSFQISGDHETIWHPQGLPGGIYFYRLQVGEFSETRKLILQK